MFRKPLRIFSRIVILWMMIGIWIPTMIQAVPGPGLVEPANGATGISTHPDLVWNTVDLSKSYQVQVSISETFSPLLVDTWDVYSNSYSLSGLITNTTYYWRIRAYLSVFFPDTTDWSKIWSFTTVTGSSITLVSPNGGEIWTTDSTYKIVWSPGTGITAVDLMYRIHPDHGYITIKTEVPTFPDTSYEWKIPGTPSTRCQVWITDSYNSEIFDESDKEFEIRCHVDTPRLISPTGGKRNVLVPVTFRWQPVRNAVSYFLDITTDASFSSFAIRDTALTDTFYVANSLTENFQYYWRVRAKTATCEGSWFSPGNFFTANRVPYINLLPTAMTFVANQTGNVPAPQNLTIYNTGGGVLNCRVSHLPEWLSIVPDSVFGSSELMQFQITHTNLVPGIYNQVIQVTDVINSALGKTQIASNNPQRCIVTYRVNPPVIPLSIAAPTRLTASLTTQLSSGYQVIRLRWTDRSDNELGFRIERRIGSKGTWAQLASIPANFTTYDDLDLVNGRTYYYRVCAYTSTQYSAYSNIAGASAILSMPPRCLITLSAIPVSPTSVRLYWAIDPGSQTHFLITRGTDTLMLWGIDSVNADIRTYLDTGLVTYTRYFYRVLPVNAVGTAACRMMVSATPVIPPFDAVFRVTYTPQDNPFADNAAAGASLCLFDTYAGIFRPVGTTGADGRIRISNVQMGQQYLAKCKLVSHHTSASNHHLVDNIDYELWGYSDVLDPGIGDRAVYVPFTITEQRDEYQLRLGHPIIKFNLMVSIQGNMPGSYFNSLYNEFDSASVFLFNVTDGQAMLGKIGICDNSLYWNDCTIQYIPGEWPHATVNGFWSRSGHICMDRGLNFKSPHPNIVIHECGHYIFALWDEYLDGDEQSWGSRAGAAHITFDRYKCQNRMPMNFGFMENECTTTEASSPNDYIPGAKDFAVEQQTHQMKENEETCWGGIQRIIETSFRNNNIRMFVQAPWYGVFTASSNCAVSINGSSSTPDREGPVLDLLEPGNRPEIVAVDEAGSYSALITAQTPQGRSLSGADVYLKHGRQISYCGKTTRDGSLKIYGFEDTDTVLFAKVSGSILYPGRKTMKSHEADQMVTIIADPTLQSLKRIALADTSVYDTVPIGVIFEITPLSLGTTMRLKLDLICDQTISQNPDVAYSCGTQSGSLELVPGPADNTFTGTIELNAQDLAIPNNTAFEITLVNTLGLVNSFISMYQNFEIVDSLDYVISSRNVQTFIHTEDFIQNPNLGISISTTIPCSAAQQGLYMVLGMYSIRNYALSAISQGINLNINYRDDDLVGFDFDAIRLYYWDLKFLKWMEMPGTIINPAQKTISATITQLGTYAIFATSMAGDPVPPGKIEDLGAVPGEDQGLVRLTWTSQGDDGTIGTASYLVIKADTAEITDSVWDALPVLSTVNPLLSAGEADSQVVRMNFSSRGYYFAVKAYDKYGNQSLVSNSAMAYSGYSRYDTAWVAVDVTETPIPDRFALYQNYPNPFNPLTQIEFDISESGSVTLRIYNILGQEVTCLLEKNMAPGRYTVQWNTRGLASGLYFYRLQQGQNSQVRKMLLLR